MAHDDATRNKLQSSQYRARCVALLALAFLCVMLAVVSLAYNFGLITRTQQVATRYVQAQPVTDILLVMSYNESDQNTSSARDGVLDVMERSSVGVDVVYMDAHNISPNSAAYDAWVAQLGQRVAQHGRYGAVICADDEALFFIEGAHDTMFESTPVVFFGINDVDHALRATASGYMTGMIEQSYFGSMMQAVMQLHPEATTFTAIIDDTPTGVGNRGQFDLAMESFEDMDVCYVNASRLTRNELASSIAGVGEDSILFLLDANNDLNGNAYDFDSTVAFVTDASTVPVYRTSAGGVGNGIAGSGYLDPEQDGRMAATMTVDVLNGTQPADIPVNLEGTQGYVFDHQVLNAHGLSTLNLPAGSTVINRIPFSLDTIMLFAIPAALVVLAGLFLWLAFRMARQAKRSLVSAQVQAQAQAASAAPVAAVAAVAVAEKPAAQKSSAQVRVKKKQAPQKGDRKRRAKMRRRHQVNAGTEPVVVHDEEPVTDAAEAVDSPHATTEPETRPEAERAPKPEPVTEPEVEAAMEPEPEPEPMAEPEAAREPESEVESPAPEAAKPDDVQEAAEETQAEAVSVEDMQEQVRKDMALQASELKSLVAIKVVDFAEIVDQYGNKAAEEVISTIGKRLEGVENALVVDTEGSTLFAGFDTEILRGSQELEFIDFLLRQPAVMGEGNINFKCCTGIVNHQRGMDVEEMIAGARFAIEQAEELHLVNSAVFYDSNMRRAMEGQAPITKLLEQAVADESFIVYYQPQIDLRENEVVGYEALVRLRNREYPPAQFIPVAERTGLIVSIDRIVVKRAIEQLSKWKRRNKRMRPISINFSSVHLTREDDDFITYLTGLLHKYDIPPAYIRIEISEALFNSDPTRAEAFLTRLFQEGITIALDHFGMGYTSFADIMTVPASIVKIDKEFVDTFLVDGKDANFEQLVMLAKGLGKRVVVVGVDKKWQLDVCRQLNCDAVQGYYFSKPLLPESAAQYKPGS